MHTRSANFCSLKETHVIASCQSVAIGTYVKEKPLVGPTGSRKGVDGFSTTPNVEAFDCPGMAGCNKEVRLGWMEFDLVPLIKLKHSTAKRTWVMPAPDAEKTCMISAPLEISYKAQEREKEPAAMTVGEMGEMLKEDMMPGDG